MASTPVERTSPNHDLAQREVAGIELQTEGSFPLADPRNKEVFYGMRPVSARSFHPCPPIMDLFFNCLSDPLIFFDS